MIHYLMIAVVVILFGIVFGIPIVMVIMVLLGL